MNVETRQQGGGAPGLYEVYVVELREHALALVWMGYRQMEATTFADAEEDDITGELVRHMKSVVEGDTAPPWVEHYSVAEQVRSDAAGRLGKRRPIVDVEFERHRRGDRPRLRIEAKRLGRGSGVSDYLGREGLGAFLTGHYSRTHNEAGMLGYIQTGTEADWAAGIATKLSANPKRFLLTSQGGWKHLSIADAPPHCYQSDHVDAQKLPLLILHVLLRFCPALA